VKLEAECCSFLTMTVHASEDTIVLEVTGPRQAQPLIAELFTARKTANPASFRV